MEDLLELLRNFYGTVLSKQGKEYSKSGMINFRADLNRYLQNLPNNRPCEVIQKLLKITTS